MVRNRPKRNKRAASSVSPPRPTLEPPITPLPRPTGWPPFSLSDLTTLPRIHESRRASLTRLYILLSQIALFVSTFAQIVDLFAREQIRRFWFLSDNFFFFFPSLRFILIILFRFTFFLSFFFPTPKHTRGNAFVRYYVVGQCHSFVFVSFCFLLVLPFIFSLISFVCSFLFFSLSFYIFFFSFSTNKYEKRYSTIDYVYWDRL